jgi:hypothetical protein
MIESIERLDAQFEGTGFRKTYILLKRQSARMLIRLEANCDARQVAGSGVV